MIKLETEFKSGEGGYSSDPLTYTQVIRNEWFAVYCRSKSNGRPKDWETIIIKVSPKGHKIFKKVYLDDTEEYPSTGQFGSKAWSFRNKQAAIDKFNFLIKSQRRKDLI
jgi:hypothetical protein